MDSDAERAPDLPECISDGHDYRAVDAGRPGSGLYIARCVRLNIAARDRFVAFGCEASHALPDRHKRDDFRDVRRKTDLSFENQNTIFNQVDGSGVCVELADYLFEVLLHAATLAGCHSRRQLPVRFCSKGLRGHGRPRFNKDV